MAILLNLVKSKSHVICRMVCDVRYLDTAEEAIDSVLLDVFTINSCLLSRPETLRKVMFAVFDAECTSLSPGRRCGETW